MKHAARNSSNSIRSRLSRIEKWEIGLALVVISTMPWIHRSAWRLFTGFSATSCFLPVPCASTSGWERIEATEDHGSFNRIYRNAIHEGEWRRDAQGRGRRAKGGVVETDRVVHLNVTYREASNGASDVLVPRARQRWPTPKSSPIHSPLEIVETCKPKVPHVARKFRCEASFSSLFSLARNGD